MIGRPPIPPPLAQTKLDAGPDVLEPMRRQLFGLILATRAF